MVEENWNSEDPEGREDREGREGREGRGASDSVHAEDREGREDDSRESEGNEDHREDDSRKSDEGNEDHREDGPRSESAEPNEGIANVSEEAVTVPHDQVVSDSEVPSYARDEDTSSVSRDETADEGVSGYEEPTSNSNSDSAQSSGRKPAREAVGAPNDGEEDGVDSSQKNSTEAYRNTGSQVYEG